MIILLTGKPGVGKTTALKKFVELYDQPSNWVITSRIPNPSGDGGLGFIATNSQGQTQTVSHKTDIPSDIVVGRNHVDVKAVEKMFVPILQDILDQPQKLAIIDEIGPIEMASPMFEALLPRVLSPKNDLVAIVHLEEERLEQYRQSTDNVLLHVSLENRDTLPRALLVMAQHRQKFNELDEKQRKVVIALLKEYISKAQLLQVEKLMKNAIYYATSGYVSRVTDGRWLVQGKHGSYAVTKNVSEYSCICDLFNGKAKYADHAGECSHTQGVKIFEA